MIALAVHIDAGADRPAALSPEPLFRVLGPVGIVGGAGPVPVPPGRQQAVLALLLLDAAQVVSTDRVIDVLWNHEPPDTARTQVQICVSRLRKSLAAGRADARILTRPPGYLLQVDAGRIDAQMFAEAVATARGLNGHGRHDEAVVALRDAMGLWRGPALSGITHPALRIRAQRLDEDRLDTAETLCETELRLGHHHRLVGTLGRLVRENPLRERLRMLLMLALYRAGRQAEALEAYRSGRELLIAQSGLEPGEALRSLAAAILTDAPELHAPPAADGRDTAARAGSAADPAPPAEPVAAVGPPAAPRPRQLPADTTDLVVDEAVVRAATDGLVGDADTGRIVLVAGPPGVGKSAFAVHVGHRLAAGHFPDGQLYCTLHHTVSDPPDVTEILGRFLNALGIPGPMVPAGRAGRGEMYRTLLADRRLLVVIDDATTEGQVLPLLPGSGRSAVLVTSRFRLGGLPGVRRVGLGNLSQAQGRTLLERVAGAERVAREPAAAATLIRTVAGLPLAVRIIGARLAARPHWTLASMVRRLSDEQHLLDELSHGEMTIRASLTLACDGLEPSSRRLFALLGLVDGPSMPAWVAGAVLGDRRADPTDLLDPLIDVQLLDVVASDGSDARFRFQDVIKVYARECQLAANPADARCGGPLRRLVGGWLAVTEQAHRAVYGGEYTVLHGDGERWRPHESGPQPDDPLGRLEVERANLTAAVAQAARAGLHELCWDLAVTATTLFEAHGHLDDWEQTHELALTAVRAAGNERGTAALLASLGTLHLTRSRPDRAEAALVAALGSFEEIGDALGLGLCRRDLALLRRQAGDDESALVLYARALRDFDRAGDVVGRAIVLTQRAEILSRRDRLPAAYTDLHEALGIQQDLHYLGGIARTKRRIGQVQSLSGDHDRAVATLCEVLEMVTAGGDVIGQTHLLRNLGEVEEARGRRPRALGYFRRALTVCERIMDVRGAATIRARLQSLHPGPAG